MGKLEILSREVREGVETETKRQTTDVIRHNNDIMVKYVVCYQLVFLVEGDKGRFFQYVDGFYEARISFLSYFLRTVNT